MPVRITGQVRTAKVDRKLQAISQAVTPPLTWCARALTVAVAPNGRD